MSGDRKVPFEYDVALSFARQDEAAAQKFASRLESRGMHVFRDEYQPGAPWGRDPVDHVVNLYARKARYCILLVSEHYPLAQWTTEERIQAQESAFREADEYVLPVQLDDRNVPGLSQAPKYSEQTIKRIADRIEQNLKRSIDSSGPPAESHDLRSGNVPSTRSTRDEP